MRKDFSEIEFQVALMMGYYSLESSLDDLGFYMPTAKEEKEDYASDWFIKNCRGLEVFLQFKKSEPATESQVQQRLNGVGADSQGRIIFGYKDSGQNTFKIKLRKEDNYLQHNLLYEKLSNHNSLSFYVAPLFTTRNELHYKLRKWLDREGIREQYYYHLRNNLYWERLDYLSRGFTFFDDVIYIKPHREITDTNQHYYVSNIHGHVTFHSEMEQNIESNGILGVLKEVREKINEGLLDSLIERTVKLHKVILEDLEQSYMDELGRNNFYRSPVFREFFKQNIVWSKENPKEFIRLVNRVLLDHYGISRMFVYEKGW